MKRTTVSFRCSDNLLEELDDIADENYMDRTGVIIQAVLSYLRSSDELPPPETDLEEE